MAQWDQVPYQYQLHNYVQAIHDASVTRRLISNECERLHQYPTDYTAAILLDKEASYEDIESRRQSLLGNSWQLGVAQFILMAILQPLVVHSSATDSVGPAP